MGKKRGQPSEETGSRKKTTPSRIGRACDRCQHRKLACDPTEHSCQQCQKANTWCTVTDSLTSIPAYRGEYEYLERRIEKQQHQIEDLMNQLRQLGQDVPSYEAHDPENIRYDAWKNARSVEPDRPWEREDKQANITRDLLLRNDRRNTPYSHHSEGQSPGSPSSAVTLPTPSPVSSHYDIQSRSQHKTLDPYGWGVELEPIVSESHYNYDLPSPEDFRHDTSYSSFIATTHGLQHPPSVAALPPHSTMVDYSLRYFQNHGCSTPILHEPTLLDLLAKTYGDKTFTPSVGQTVCIHMILAISLRQACLHTPEDAPKEFEVLSDRHFHHCLGLWPRLIKGTGLEDLQGLAMICQHTQSFPESEIGWATATTTFNRLVQLNWHRRQSLGPWSHDPHDILSTEIQRRVFWAVLHILVMTSGRLGRPMPMGTEEMDVELPMAVDDDQITSMGINRSKTTSSRFLAAVEIYKMLPLYIDLFSSVYGTSRSVDAASPAYIQKCEARLLERVRALPPEYSTSSKSRTTHGDSLQVRFCHAQYRLLLYQPWTTANKLIQPHDAERQKSVGAAKELLEIALNLKDTRLLEVSWPACRIYLLAMQTILLGRQQPLSESNTSVHDDIGSSLEACLSIVREISMAIGTETTLYDKVLSLVNNELVSSESSRRISRATSLKQCSIKQPRSLAPSGRSKAYVNGSDIPYRAYRSESTYSAPSQLSSTMSVNNDIQNLSYGAYEAASYERVIPASATSNQQHIIGLPPPYSDRGVLRSSPAGGENYSRPQVLNVAADTSTSRGPVYNPNGTSWYACSSGMSNVQNYPTANAILQPAAGDCTPVTSAEYTQAASAQGVYSMG